MQRVILRDDVGWDQYVMNRMTREGFISSHKTGNLPLQIHRHVGLEITLCEQGEGVFYFGDRQIPFSAGSLIVFDAEVPHLPKMSEDYVRWNICFYPPRLTTRSGRSGPFVDLTKLPPITGRIYLEPLSGSDLEHIQRLLQEMHEEGRARRRGYEVMLQLRLVELFVWLDRRKSETQTAVFTSAYRNNRGTLSRVLAYIDQNLATDLTVDSLAKAFHCSTSHLYRLMSEALGQSPSEYIRERRIAKAQYLLRQNEMTVLEVAHAVGFQDGANFTRFFRNETGETPTQYRERMLYLAARRRRAEG